MFFLKDIQYTFWATTDTSSTPPLSALSIGKLDGKVIYIIIIIIIIITEVIQSSEGVQQGNPLRPLLFCLTIHNMCSQLKSELRMFYLDDGTLGGTLTDVLQDLQLITKEAHSLGLQLKYGKSEIISNNTTIIQAMLTAVPGLQVTEPKCTTLLGTPLGQYLLLSVQK